MDSGHRPYRHRGRLLRCRGCGSETRRARDVADYRCALHNLGSWQRSRVELAFAHGLPVNRRSRHWRIVCAGACLHCRAFSSQVAWKACRCFPVQCGLGHPGGSSNYLIRLLHLGAAEWRWQVGVAAAPALGFLLLLFGIPRSPRWSASKNRIDEALAVLKLMGEPDPEAELADIRMALEQEHTSDQEPVFRWKYRYPLFLAITIGAFNQLAGINAILYYLPSIFASAGFSQISGDQQAIAIGLTNLIFTMAGMSVIDS